MNCLLDTNVVSEWTRPRPDAAVTAWLASTDEDRVYLSVITLAELRRGVDRLAPGARRSRLDAWLTGDLARRFEGRVLGVDADTADRWGAVVAEAERAGRPITAVDAFLAATCRQHGLTLVTRNVSDFAALGISVENPWGIPRL